MNILFFGGILLFVIGARHAGLFVVFLLTSWFLLVQIFNFSILHKYFWKVVFLLIGYAIVVAFFLIQFNFEKFFWDYLILSAFFLFKDHIGLLKSKETVDMIVHLQKNALNSLPESEDKKRIEENLSLSFSRMIKYHLLSSVVFIVGFILGFILAFSYFF